MGEAASFPNVARLIGEVTGRTCRLIRNALRHPQAPLSGELAEPKVQTEGVHLSFARLLNMPLIKISYSILTNPLLYAIIKL